MRKIIAAVMYVLNFLPGNSNCQHLTISPEMQARLQGKTRFFDIMNEIDIYYTSRNYYGDKKLTSEYKKWNRWAWYAARHVDANGKVDYRQAENFLEANRMRNMAARDQSSSGQWNPVGPTSTTWAVNRGSRGIGRVDRLAFHPTNTNILFAATPAGGLFKTTNGGSTWASVSPGIPNCGISGVVVGSNDPTGNTIYILTGDGDSGPGSFVSSFGFLRNSIGILVTYDGGTNWSPLGNSQAVLSGRRCFKLLQHRNFPNVFFAATSTGLFASSDFGATWALRDNVLNAVFDIEQHPTNDAVIYISLADFVVKSEDYGATFPLTGTYMPNTATATRTAVAVTPANPNDVYFLQCGSTNRIYRSVNSGSTYTAINNTDLITGQYSYNCAIAVNHTNNNFMVAGGINVLASSNNGATFPNITNGNINSAPPLNYIHADIHDLAYHPVSGLLYAACDGGVYVSSSNGVNWTDISNGLQCTQYYHTDGFDGTASLFCGGSQDNGTTVTTTGAAMNYFGAADGFAVDFPATDNNIIYYVENQSILRYTRSTNTLADISPIPVAQRTFYPNIIAHPTNNQIMYAGYNGSMWRSNQQGNAGSWTNINTANGTSGAGAGHTGGFAVSAQVPDRLYAANATQIWRSDNQGTAFTLISGNGGWPVNPGVITDLAARPNNAGEIWVASTGNNGANRITYSSNAGTSWVDFTGTLPNVAVYSIACTSGGDVYAGTELGVYFMDFAMNDWIPFYNGLPMVPVSDLFVNETNGTIAAGTFGRGIWQSDLYTDCSAFLTLSSVVQGRYFYQTAGVLQSTQKMSSSVGNELRYRTLAKINLRNGFTAKAGSYFHGVIGPCGQGVFNKSDTTAAKTKAEELGPGDVKSKK